MIIHEKARPKWSIPGRGIGLVLLPERSRLDSAGMTVTATTSDSRTDTEIATAISRNNCPASSCITRIGMNTITVVRADTRIAPQTCRAPS